MQMQSQDLPHFNENLLRGISAGFWLVLNVTSLLGFTFSQSPSNVLKKSTYDIIALVAS